MTSLVLTDDGLALPLRSWPARAHPAGPRGVAVLVHGLGEHIGRYEATARHLAAAGYAVIGHDQRGHGKAPGPRGGLPESDSLLDDLGRVVDAARAAHPGPLLLVGHSMGGLVAARFTAESLAGRPASWARPVDALVLTSPALDPGLSPVQRLLLSTVARLLPDLAVGNGLRSSWISRDPAVVEAYDQDPLVHDRITGRLGRFIADEGELVLALAPRWRVPTLLMWAGADRCVSPEGSAAFAEAAPASVVTARCWTGSFHEILNEPDRDQVLGTLTQWLDLAMPLRAAA